MPRDLSALANESTLSEMPGLTKSPEEDDSGDGDRQQSMDAQDHTEGTLFSQISQSNAKRDALHPFTQTLSLSDVESCVRLEETAFPPQERATREKFQYRLNVCGELCMGIFTSQKDSTAATAETSTPVYSGAPDRKAVLLGHIVSTKTTNLVVTDDDMAIPTTTDPDPNLGHKEEGSTICIHSFAILNDYQGRGLGSTLMKAYLQRMESHGVAERAALIAHEHLIPMYEKYGFVNKGKSKAQFGGGGWYDMVREFEPNQIDSD